MDELCALYQLGLIPTHPIPSHPIPSCYTPHYSTHPLLRCITAYIDHVMLIFEFMIGRVELVWSSRHLNPFNRNNISRFNMSPSVLNVGYYVSWKRTNWKRTRTVTVHLYLSTSHLSLFSRRSDPTVTVAC